MSCSSGRIARLRAVCAEAGIDAFLVRDTSGIRWLTGFDGVFDEVLAAYTSSAELVEVRTTNMGSLYRLQYHVLMRSGAHEKEFIDELRCRNGNLEIVLGRVAADHEEL